MKIAIIGSGYVGLVSGACFAELGWAVTCVDKDAAKIAQLKAGKSPIYEPGLDALIARNQGAERLHFTTDLAQAVQNAQIVFIAVGTPSDATGEADLTYVYEAARAIGKALTHPTLIVTKSTVPVGTGKAVAQIIRETNPKAIFDIASNPEFLREGCAIEDFMQPDRVVIGTQSDEAAATMRALYAPLAARNVPLHFTDLETAELIKYAANCFLALKVAFINEMADLCEALGSNVQEVARGIGLDHRIGPHFLQAGPGFGGSCFPKDTLALMKIAQASGSRTRIIETVIDANEERKRRMAEKIIAACGGSVKGKTLAVLGLTFKANTDDVRSSASLVILPKLLEAGAHIQAFDPQGMEETAKLLAGDIRYCRDAYEAMNGADALVILTEWSEFKTLDLARAKSLLRSPLVIDLRNLYPLEEMKRNGMHYLSLGRKPIFAQ